MNDIPQTKPNGVVVQKKHLILAAVAVVLLLAGGITLGVNWNNWFGAPGTAQTGGPGLDPGAVDWTGPALPDQTPDGQAKGIAIPGYPSISLPAHTKDVQAALVNPAGNPCYFQFELVLKDGNESLYRSGLVPPGKAVTNLTLARELPAGEYEATIKISTTSLADGKAPMNGANVETRLIVQ